MVNIFGSRHPGLGATVEMTCATFTFVTWKNLLKGQPRSKVIADFEPPGSSSHLCSIGLTRTVLKLEPMFAVLTGG